MSLNHRMLLVDLGATFGGAEVYLLNLTILIRDRISCFGLCSHPELIDRLESRGIECVRIPRATGVWKIFQIIWAFFILPYLIVRYEPATVQINGYSEIILLPLARLLGKRTIATRHLSFEIETKHWYQAPGRHIAQLLYRLCGRFATEIVCVSHVVAHEVRELVPASRVRIIPNWVRTVPPQRYTCIARSPRIKLLFVGRLIPLKGLDLLLEAVRQVSLHSNALVELTVVGGGNGRAMFERLAAGTNTRFVGFQSDVTRFYEEADIFVNPSRGPEGSPLVVLEAMSHSLPCLLSDLEIHREVSCEGTAAELFRSGTSEDLAAKLRVLIGDETQRRNLARAAHDVVERNHKPEGAALAYLQAFGVQDNI